ncbi:hypothetical protein ABK040_011343 [Willaertia magna]
MKGTTLRVASTSPSLYLIFLLSLTIVLFLTIIDLSPKQQHAFVSASTAATTAITLSNEKKVKEQQLSLECPANTKLRYQFKTVSVVGNGGPEKKDKAGSEETHTYGFIEILCPSKKIYEQQQEQLERNNKNNNRHHLFVVKFSNVHFVQYRGISKANRKYRNVILRKDFTKALQKHVMVVSQSSSGQILKLIFNQEEKRWIRTFKKGILRLFTTEIKKNARSQTDGGLGGKYVAKYNKKLAENDLTIYQTFTQHNFIRILPIHHRHLNYKASHVVHLKLEEGIVRNSTLTIDLSLGEDRRTNHYAFKVFEKKKEEAAAKKKNNAEKHLLQSDEKIKTHYVGFLKLQHAVELSDDNSKESIDHINKVVKHLKNYGRDIVLQNQWGFENTFTLTRYDRKHASQVSKSKYRKERFIQLLNIVKEDYSLSKESTRKLVELSHYARLNPVTSAFIMLSKLKKGVKELEKVSNNSKDYLKLFRFLESLQNLIATTYSEKVQNRLVELSSMHPLLANNYIYSSIVIPIPTKKVFQFLTLLKNKGVNAVKTKNLKNSLFTDLENDDTKQNAFMAYADLGSRLKNEQFKQKVVAEILARITTSKGEQQLLTNLHALNNAGKAVDLEILKAFLSNKKLPLRFKVILSDNIKKRLLDDDKLDGFIHEMVESVGYSSTLKSALINAQNEREKHLRKCTSLDSFSKVYNDSKSRLIKNSIRNYLYNCGTKQSGDKLAELWKIKAEKKKVEKKRGSTALVLSGNVLSEGDQSLLAESEEDNGVATLKLKKFFKKAKGAFKKVGKKVKSGVKKATNKVKNSAKKAAKKVKAHVKKSIAKVHKKVKDVGKHIAKAAKHVAKGVKKAVKYMKEKLEAAVKAIGKLIKDLKKRFSKVSFNKEDQVCMAASTKQDDKICLYNNHMINFVRSQGDLSTIKHSKHFEAESIVGTSSANMYNGFIIYAGASFNCKPQEKSGFDFVLYARTDNVAKVFNKELTILEASATFTKRFDQPVNDNVFVKFATTTFINKGFVPEKIRKILDLCFSEYKKLIEKRFPELLHTQIFIQIGPVPFEFSFSVGLTLGVELKYGVCVGTFEVSTSLEPYIIITLKGMASVSLKVAKAGVYISTDINYRMVPRLAFEKCDLCASLQHRMDGMNINVGLSANVLKWEKKVTFLKKQTKPFVRTLFKVCASTGIVKDLSSESSNPEWGSLKQTSSEEKGNLKDELMKLIKKDDKEGDGKKKSPSKSGISKYLENVKAGYRKMFGEGKKWDFAKDLTKELGVVKDAVNQLKPQLEPVVRISQDYLKTHIPKAILSKVPLDVLRKLPDDFFKLKSSEMEKIPEDYYYLPSKEMVEFIKKLPVSGFLTQEEMRAVNVTKVKLWSLEDLKKRLPKNVVEKIPSDLLRNLPSEILEINIKILEKVPVDLFKDPEKLMKWICKRYKKVCKAIKKEVKKEEKKEEKKEKKEKKKRNKKRHNKKNHKKGRNVRRRR